MSNYSTGHAAEQHAAAFLVKQGYKIEAINWKRPRCEIDIVALRNKTVHFIEVKHRKNSQQGSGFDYVTSKKQSQMAFAAEIWVSENSWSGAYVLGAIELSGDDYLVTGFLEQI